MGSRPCAKGEKQRNNRILIVIIVFLLVVIAVLALIIANMRGKLLAQSSGGAQPEQAKPAEKLTDSIDIPGYSQIYFVADSLEQDDTISNPPQNFCLMRISLCLEDGTLLWTSEPVKPGEKSTPIVLNKALEKGDYANAKLIYRCYRMDENQTPLNGAETKLTIKVR